MIQSAVDSSSAATDAFRDPTGSALRARAGADPKAALQSAARQFEAIFMQQVMKSMREAGSSSGLLENAGTQMGSEMLDGQYANQMTGLKGGLSDLIARQLAQQMGAQSTDAGAGPASGSDAASASGHGSFLRGRTTVLSPAGAAGAPTGSGVMKPLKLSRDDFLTVHQTSARAAEAATGIPATFMVAQAAHESGWGKHEIRNADGSTSFNLFGMKAGSNWKGRVANVTTTEVVDGEPRKVVAKFRAYDSYEESFKDYAAMMKGNPRYAGVVASSSTPETFAKGLQRAGYATDPAYAEKLTRVINTSLRLQRAVTARANENMA